MRKLITLLFIFIILAGGCQCNQPNDPLPPAIMPSITGRWEASGNFSNIPFLVIANLTQAEGDTAFSGTGKLAALTQSRDFSTKGVNSYPMVRMTFSDVKDTLTWAGAFVDGNDNRIEGLLQAPAFGLADYPLVFNRTANVEAEAIHALNKIVMDLLLQ